MMDCGTTDIRKGKKIGITQSTIAHMARKNRVENLVVEMAFVSIRELDALVRSVKEAPSVSIMYGNMTAGRDVEVNVFVTMGTESLFVYLVVVLGFVSMGNKKGFARIVMVDSCAKPHTVLR